MKVYFLPLVVANVRVSFAVGVVALVKLNPTAAAETFRPVNPRPVTSEAVTGEPLLVSLLLTVIIEPATLSTTDIEEFVAPTPVPVVAIRLTPLKVADWAY